MHRSDLIKFLLDSIQLFSAAKLFNSLPCRFLGVHHFANETLFQKIISSKIFFNSRLKIVNKKNFRKKFPYKVVYAFSFGGFKFVGVLFEFFVTKKFQGCPVKCFAKIIAMGNAVQILSNFPAKRLSIYRKKNFVTPLIN